MTPELADTVRRVFTAGLDLKDRLDRGETPLLAAEQATLRRLLFPGPVADAWPDFVGDADPAGSGSAYLGLRYALACWLDELIIVYTPWDSVWNEAKLEAAFYETNDRAWKFWEQAKAADDRPDPALTGVYLQCVALGFRGDYRNSPDQLTEWLERAKGRVCRPPTGGWTPPPYLPPPSGAPPLTGREQLRRMALSAGWVLLLALPVIAYLAVRQLGE